MVSPVTTSVSPVTNIITRDNFAPSYDNIIFHASQKVRNTSHALLDMQGNILLNVVVYHQHNVNMCQSCYQICQSCYFFSGNRTDSNRTDIMDIYHSISSDPSHIITHWDV